MSVTQTEQLPEINWAELEAQLHDGGNGFGNGNGGEEDDHRREWGDDNYRDPHTFANLGAFAGLGTGWVVSVIATGEYDRIARREYISNHHITTEAGKTHAFYAAPNKNVEFGIFSAPLFTLAAIGVAIGYIIDKRRKKN